MENAEPVVLQFAGLTLDQAARALLDPRGRDVALRRSEFDLLLTFASRPGRVLTRDQLLDAVAGRRSEPYDRTIDVLVGRLRQKIELDPKQPHLIVTVPGVGYKFTARPHRVAPASPEIDGNRSLTVTPGVSAPITADSRIANAPRFSLVILPFENLGGDAADDYLADSITDDLTSVASSWPDDVLVIARTSAATYKGRFIDARKVGEELGVRYVVEGSVRKVGDILHVNVQLISTETNAHVWAGLFEQHIGDIGTGQEEIVSRLRAVLRIQIFDAEIGRGARERPRNPDAFDLVLRARALSYRMWTSETLCQKTALLEHALRLDPLSVQATCLLAMTLFDRCVIPDRPDFGDENLIERITALVCTAADIDPNNYEFILANAGLLRLQGRLAEAITEFERLIRLHPNSWEVYRQLGFTKLAFGLPEDAILLLKKSIRVDPLSPYTHASYARIGLAFLMLGHEAECIEWEQRALAAAGNASPAWKAHCSLLMASAHALLGELDDAHDGVANANHLWPFGTVRTLPRTVVPPRGLPSPAFMARMQRTREGLRLAGLRDHADEAAASNEVPAGNLHVDAIGLTPATAPGATTIHTCELAEILSVQAPILIDVAADSWGQSLPGAIGLQGVGNGAPFGEGVQGRFYEKIMQLTKGDLSKPIVAFCANSERFTGYNLALRLAALGCTQVFWYRGGVEAWQVNGLPMTDLVLHDW